MHFFVLKIFYKNIKKTLKNIDKKINGGII